MKKKALLAAVVSLSCCLGLYAQRSRAQAAEHENYHQMAWNLRRGDAGEPLSEPQSLALEGKYAEALSQLNPVRTQADKDLQGELWECLLFDLDWPALVVKHSQIASTRKRSRLLVRCVQSGKLDELDRLKIEAFIWSPGQWSRLEGLKTGDWASVTDLKVVHLERKDERLGQLWIAGRTRSGKHRVEVLYGLESWKQWVVEDDKAPVCEKDRVLVNGSTYKLVVDEWIEVKL